MWDRWWANLGTNGPSLRCWRPDASTARPPLCPDWAPTAVPRRSAGHSASSLPFEGILKRTSIVHTHISNIIVLHMYLYRCCMRIHVYNVYIVYVTIWWCDDMWWFIELEASKCSSCKGLYRCRRHHRRLPPPHHPPPYPPHPHPPPPHHHYHHRNHLTVVIRIIHW